MQILACPGQGSQTEGFLVPWLDEVPGFKEQLRLLSEYADMDLLHLGTSASEEQIKDTSNAQPLIVAASIAAFRSNEQRFSPDGVLGHSVGEFAAAAISGVISDQDAMQLVKIRATAMASAAEETATSMAAILGGDIEQITSHLSGLELVIANHNGAGQVVAAGAKEKILELVADPPEKTRAIELKVAGAFHTSFMASAQQELAKHASNVTAQDPKIRLWSNKDGLEVSSGQAYLDSLVTQVSNPVRWDLCMESLVGQELVFIELPPAGALAGLAKRGIPGCKAIALKTPSDFEKVSA